MLGVLSMPEFDKGELHIHTDVKDIEKVYAMINQAGLNSTQAVSYTHLTLPTNREV